MFYWDRMRIGSHDSKSSRRSISISALQHIRYFKLRVYVFLITIFIFYSDYMHHRMEKISWTYHVRKEEVLFGVKEQRNVLH
jgi:hypothetical protein